MELIIKHFEVNNMKKTILANIDVNNDNYDIYIDEKGYSIGYSPTSKKLTKDEEKYIIKYVKTTLNG